MYTYIDPTYQARRIKKRSDSISFLSILMTILSPIARVCRDFCLWTSMHGFNHISWPGRHWFERILWVFVTAAAIWGAVDISLGQLQRYNENPTVVTIEKDFRTWRYSLPSITTCEKNRVKPEKLPAVIKSYWNITPEHEKYDYYSRFVSTVANSDIFHLDGFADFKNDDSLNVDMFQLVQDVVPQMTSLKDTWPNDMTPTWYPVMTEAGACYNVNSLAIADVVTTTVNPNDTKTYPLTCKYSSSICAVMLEAFNTNFTFYLHSPYDIMDISTPPKCDTVFLRSRTLAYNVIETRSGKGIQELAPARRGCRYTFEPLSNKKKVFSTNTCRQSCRVKLALDKCKCKPFYYTNEDGPTCNPSGMACVASISAKLANFDGERCACAQQCVTSVFQEISVDDVVWSGGPFANRGSARLVINAPRTRYTREIVFHFQDLVVSFGGAAGLFLGASFISFVEILYFILERVFMSCIEGSSKNKENTAQNPEKKQKMSYESSRVMELNKILERQRKFEHGRHMKLYY